DIESCRFPSVHNKCFQRSGRNLIPVDADLDDWRYRSVVWRWRSTAAWWIIVLSRWIVISATWRVIVLSRWIVISATWRVIIVSRWIIVTLCKDPVVNLEQVFPFSLEHEEDRLYACDPIQFRLDGLPLISTAC